ncbi:HNH endonuclease [bacterium]|nr:HNH endonuclease [bacterium]
MKTCTIEGCEAQHKAKGLCIIHYRRQQYHGNKEIELERMKPYGKQYRKDNKNRISKYLKQYYLSNKKELAERHKEYHQAHKEQLNKLSKIYIKQYRKTPAGKAVMKADKHNRRTLTRDLTKATIQQVYEDNIKKYGRLTCVLCFKPIEFGDDSLEHLTPLTRKGTNNYDNLGVAHYVCNCKKHTMTLEEWYAKS